MWISAWTGRPAYAAIQAITPTLGVLVWVWLVSWGGIQALSTRPPNAFVAFSVLLVLLSAVFVSFGRRGLLREKLASELRLIACAPIPERGDKRFRKWDPNLIFPPGRWGEFPLLPAKSRPAR
jgi:hypothetical protein